MIRCGCMNPLLPLLTKVFIQMGMLEEKTMNLRLPNFWCHIWRYVDVTSACVRDVAFPSKGKGYPLITSHLTEHKLGTVAEILDAASSIKIMITSDLLDYLVCSLYA